MLSLWFGKGLREYARAAWSESVAAIAKDPDSTYWEDPLQVSYSLRDRGAH